MSQEMKSDYPRLSEELGSDSPTELIQHAIGSWQSAWRNQTLPWIIFGLFSFTIGTVWSRVYKQTPQVGDGEAEVDVLSESESGNANPLPSEPESHAPERTGA